MNYRFDNCFMASTKDHICWKKRDLYLVLFSSNICCLNRFGRLAAICLITCYRKFHHFTEGGGEDQDRRASWCPLVSD